MNRIFIEIFLDEDVDVLVADLVRVRGFRATTTQEAGLKGSNDTEQLAYTVSFQSTLLTHNRLHFESLVQEYCATGKKHYGIIVATRRPVYTLVKRLLIILNRLTTEEMMNQIRYI